MVGTAYDEGRSKLEWKADIADLTDQNNPMKVKNEGI
jgi:hypothetical protein